MFRRYLIIADEGMSGYFLAHLHRKYKENIDEPNNTEMNEYIFYPSKLSHRLHAHEVLGEKINSNEAIHEDGIDIENSMVTWVFVDDDELLFKLIYLAQLKHDNVEPISRIRGKIGIRRDRHISSYNRNKHLPEKIFELDYQKFFIDADERIIRGWCEFNEILYTAEIRRDIIEYTNKNKIILDKHNVQL